MTDKIAETHDRLKDLYEQKRTLEQQIEAEGNNINLRIKLADILEDITETNRYLKELNPSHKLKMPKAWTAITEHTWDNIEYQTWLELESSNSEDGPSEYDNMKLSFNTAMNTYSTEKQTEYMNLNIHGQTMTDIAKERGLNKSTVSRTIKRRKITIEKNAKAIYKLLGHQSGIITKENPLVIDLSNKDVLNIIADRLTNHQLLNMYLYYIEWLSLREIGSLLGIHHTVVFRSIQSGLKKITDICVGEHVIVCGIDNIEESLITQLLLNSSRIDDIIKEACIKKPLKLNKREETYNKISDTPIMIKQMKITLLGNDNRITIQVGDTIRKIISKGKDIIPSKTISNYIQEKIKPIVKNKPSRFRISIFKSIFYLIFKCLRKGEKNDNYQD